MRVAVVTDLHFFKDQKENSYTDAMYGYEFFQRYHNVFEEVLVVARGKKIEKTPKNCLRINGDGISTFLLPATKGVAEYARNYFSLYKKMKTAILMCDTVIIRTPSALSIMAVQIAQRLKKPYALEVVADPNSVKSSNSIKDKFIRNYVVRKCKDACMKANGVAYVTKYFLQEICPCQAIANGKETDSYFTGNYSSVVLPSTYYAKPRDYSGKKAFTLVHTANIIGSEAKGHSIVIRVLSELRKKSYNVTAIFVGDGPGVERFKALAKDLNVENYVSFVGKFADPSLVREQLLNSDVYILPSESEGLPRGVIEAMACGLVALASNVSGIPELLNEEDMCAPKDVNGYVRRLSYLFDHTEEMTALSVRNIDVAKQYGTENLTKSRNLFYNKLRKLTEKKQRGE